MMDNRSKYEFADKTRELCVIVTITNWDEPPRIRHEMAYQLSKRFNVLFIQVFSQRKYRRRKKKINGCIIIEKAGFSFIGIQKVFAKFSFLRESYNSILSALIRKKVTAYGYNKAHLINFQYDFPQVYDQNIWMKKIYFCNEDWINQHSNQSKQNKSRKESLQNRVLENSDIAVTVSYPLQEKLAKFGKKVEIILSGHSFDLDKSIAHVKQKTDYIDVCYMGFLNQYVSVDWFEHVLQQESIRLTIIGPIAYQSLIDKIKDHSRFKHIKCLTGEKLQNALLEQDVLLMPYSSSNDKEITTAPAKLFQYLAVGKPIVSSQMNSLLKLPAKFVYKASDKEAFFELIKNSYDEDSDLLRRKRIEFSSNHSWDSRGKQIIKYLLEL
jgi:glycosyltransferase involved in cell wall biosynthesis